MATIGKIFVAAGGLILAFWPEESQIGQAFITIGTGLSQGKGSIGPIRVGNDGITVAVASWQGE
jgi:hypothetical protein